MNQKIFITMNVSTHRRMEKSISLRVKSDLVEYDKKSRRNSNFTQTYSRPFISTYLQVDRFFFEIA